ncbi:DUF6653 family protein [Vibrio spartinae]|uniref:Uncharacterized protein n=1 Tax=Vibrio spartinae TaxID=1918945 RepID=A0A1N6M614_9VIBR|nr:DUF6653 family protein [Vibrio spartinae]QMV14840.1 hypothetical protein Vspart_02115 [Vibrio spartinae]SIO94882.1 hypothetical protein VSP9026_02613 [Vibrio spartinae]
MTLERKLATLFHLDDNGWGRHANPWSVWTRYSVLPLFIIAGLLREWNGWLSLLILVMALVWMFLNPILFPKPLSLQSWATQSVLGERIYLNRDKEPLPKVHQLPLFMILHLTSTLGLILAGWGVYQYDIQLCILSVLITYLAKSWFLDRMVWLYCDFSREHQSSE